MIESTPAYGRSSVRRALVIGAGPSVGEHVVDPLRTAGLVVEVAPGGAVGREAAMARRPDVIVLDEPLSDSTGTRMVRRLREAGLRTPIMVITTSHLRHVLVQALAAGADDCLGPQVAAAELVARVQNLIRRAGPRPGASDVLRYADVVFDETLHLVHRAGAVIDLSPMQYRLLRYFMLNPRRALSKEALLLQVWNRERADDYNLVETAVGRVRRKLEKHGPPLIHTLHSRGYILRGQD